MVDAEKFAISGFWESLACAALQPGLRGILVFNANPGLLANTAMFLQDLLEIADGQQPEIISLGPSLTDDDLWGNLSFSNKHSQETANNLQITWQTGLLVRSLKPQILIVNDLARASLAVLRAATVLLDAPSGEIQRNGRSERWNPNLIWLAGCNREDVGQVSVHLLDRFALRLHAPNLHLTDRVSDILKWLEQTRQLSIASMTDSPLAEAFSLKLMKAKNISSIPGEGYFERLFEYFPSPEIGMRHEIALVRLSRACAQLELSDYLLAAHIDQAARLIGLKKIEKTEKFPGQQTEFEYETCSEAPSSDDIGRSEKDNKGQTETEDVFPGERNEKAIPLNFPYLGNLERIPWPEEQTIIEHEFGSLRYPIRTRHNRAEHGPVIGIKKATMVADISIFGTVMESAKYRVVRMQFQPELVALQPIWPTDLRSYRRSLLPNSLLAILMDYTCLKGVNWENALLPYLHWAYINRASVCVIQVGAVTARNELCSERILGRNILDPKIGRALTLQAGKATPLAHGLEIAYQTLQKIYHRGDKNTLLAKFIVITDGRGNIPLIASQTHNVQFPVGSRGVDDALTIARSISKFQTLEKILIHPKCQQYTRLPIQMAIALGASIFEIPEYKD